MGLMVQWFPWFRYWISPTCLYNVFALPMDNLTFLKNLNIFD